MQRNLKLLATMGLLCAPLCGCNDRDDYNEVGNAIAALGNYPRVCLSDIKASRKDDRIAFFAVVSNVGAADSKTPFEVIVTPRQQSQGGTIGGSIAEGYYKIPASLVLKGTGSNPASSAGPNLLVDLQFAGGDPNKFYGPFGADQYFHVEAELYSTDDNFKIASAGCSKFVKIFRGDQPL